MVYFPASQHYSIFKEKCHIFDQKNDLLHKYTFGLRHEISNNVVCATSKVRHAVRSETLLYSHLNIL